MEMTSFRPYLCHRILYKFGILFVTDVVDETRVLRKFAQ